MQRQEKGCYFSERSMHPQCHALWNRAINAEYALARVCKFLNAYAKGQAVTFVDPHTGMLVSTTKEARALAHACLEGPAAEEATKRTGS